MSTLLKYAGGAVVAGGMGLFGIISTGQDNAAAAEKYGLSPQQASVMHVCVKDLDTNNESYYATGLNDHEVCACIAKDLRVSAKAAIFFEVGSEDYRGMMSGSDRFMEKIQTRYVSTFGTELNPDTMLADIERTLARYEQSESKCAGWK